MSTRHDSRRLRRSLEGAIDISVRADRSRAHKRIDPAPSGGPLVRRSVGASSTCLICNSWLLNRMHVGALLLTSPTVMKAHAVGTAGICASCWNEDLPVQASERTCEPRVGSHPRGSSRWSHDGDASVPRHDEHNAVECRMRRAAVIHIKAAVARQPPKMAYAVQPKTGFHHRGARDRHHRYQCGCGGLHPIFRLVNEASAAITTFPHAHAASHRSLSSST
jgi:hypothetical protein